jgi:threonylcarbamoyladenosine tRNA methylthiotransferase MtaB
MHRKYRPHHYESRVRLARELMPDGAIGADVMTGFPGETEDEFKATCEFIERLPFTYLHIFPYSERPGTPAADATDHVPWQKRKERGRVLKSLADAKNVEFRRAMVGRTLSAVTLGNGEAITSNYLPVQLASERPARQLIDVKIGGVAGGGLREAAAFTVLG